MAQTLVSLYVHIIFSTKHRKKIIQPEVEPALFAYIGGSANNNKSKLLAAGGTDDHVHLLASMSKNICLSEFVGDIKRDSSVWIKVSEQHIQQLPLAGRIRRVLRRIHAAPGGEALYRPTERTSRASFVQGRV